MKFTFKDKADYQAQREALINEAQEFINSGNTSDANAKMEDIKIMDNEFSEFAKAQANLSAMTNSNNKVNPLGKFNNLEENQMNNENKGMLNSVEYRTAFMENVLSGKSMPAQFQNATNASTTTTDVSVVIPTTIMQKIIEKLEEHGHILGLVTQTNYKGGLSVPTNSAKPTATWVSERSTSTTQKTSLGSITFAYYKLRCAISMSLEVETVTLDFFETYFVNQVTKAMIEALETSIIKGTGVSQPKGILTEEVVTGQNVNIAKTASITYKTLWDMKKAVPSGYRNSVKFCMNYATFCDIMALTDQQGQPIARVNYGLNGGTQATILGTPVVFSDDVDAYVEAPTADSVVAFLFNFSDYILNTNLAMTIKQYEDDNTDDKITKAIMLVDGKVVDKNSLVTLTKKSA